MKEKYWQGIQKVQSFEEKSKLVSECLVSENEARKLFAQDRSNPVLSDPYLMMLPIHSLPEFFFFFFFFYFFFFFFFFFLDYFKYLLFPLVVL